AAQSIEISSASDDDCCRRCLPSEPIARASLSSILLRQSSKVRFLSHFSGVFLAGQALVAALRGNCCGSRGISMANWGVLVWYYRNSWSQLFPCLQKNGESLMIWSFTGEGFDPSPSRDVRNHLILDQILLVTEILCIAPSVIFSIGCLVGSVLPGATKQFQMYLSNKVFVYQYFLLVGAVAVGSLIRWRQICMLNEIGTGADLVRRIEKMEEELRSSATIIRVLSKHLEKLGIRFRVTRKALKEPIAEVIITFGFQLHISGVLQTAALAQKNSEATRALAMQEDILEKELGEIQKVLLAMQVSLLFTRVIIY
ncbi:hypothetical protein B296_00018700, partial [Ensete ventricosum]